MAPDFETAPYRNNPATTKNRVDLSLRLEGQKLVGRLLPSIHETMRLQISLIALDDVASEAPN